MIYCSECVFLAENRGTCKVSGFVNEVWFFAESLPEPHHIRGGMKRGQSLAAERRNQWRMRGCVVVVVVVHQYVRSHNV